MLGEKEGRLLERTGPDYVVFDLETTGLSTRKSAIIEISAIRVRNGRPEAEYTTLVNPGVPIPYDASQVNGITNAMTANAPDLSSVLPVFLDFIGEDVLVGHNIARFDMKILSRDVRKYYHQELANPYLDSLPLARRCLPELGHYRLTELAHYYQISDKGAHRALNDCRMNQLIYEKLRQILYEKEHPASSLSAKTQSENPDYLSDSLQKSAVQNTAPTARLPRLRAVVERITYQNPENGYTILKCAVKGEKDLVPVVGNLLDVNVGSVLLVEGTWKIDARYGRQFLAQSWEETLPATVFGIEKYLGSGMIKGVGPKFAKRIVQKFGTDTIRILEEDIDRLQEIDGIGKKRILRIKESWEKQKEIKNVMLFLQSHGVSTSFAARIYKVYGAESIEKILTNPYCLADDIWGIGFKTADSIAQKLGFDKESYVRLRSGLIYTLNTLADEGHVFAERVQLLDTAAALLEADTQKLAQTLEQMLKDQVLFQETYLPADRMADILPQEAIYLPAFYFAEIGVANKLKKLRDAPANDRLWQRLQEAREKTGNPNLSIDIGQVEKKLGMSYDTVQAEAIRLAAASKVMVLTGGPGTGKTTTTQGILSVFQSFGLRMLLAAPTGRAARRMTEATGREASTVHRLLECKPPSGYLKNEDNPLDGDVLIIDECSMIDLVLMNALLKAIPAHMRLILVGDIDQLPSVGAGNVLRNIMDSGTVPVIRLTKIFRQAQTSRIITNAHRINAGQLPDLSGGSHSDFFFMEEEDPEAAAAQIIELVKTKLPAYYRIPSAQIQVLSPMQRGITGAANMNLLLQEALNPSGDGLRRGGYLFRPADKVMQIKNNYEKEVFNGDIGTIQNVDLTERSLKVSFDGRLIEYDAAELDELVHAYAITIHKSQGSEYPIVVMPILMNHYVMLQRNLLYTGITRAKQILVLVGTKKAIGLAVRNVKVTRRNSLLSERLAFPAAFNKHPFLPEAQSESRPS